MTSSHRDKVQRFHDLIRAAVMNEWDPIGVRGIAEAADEYDSYVPAICKLFTDGRPKSEVFEYLWWLETEHMGLTGDRQATERFADRLAQLCESSCAMDG